MKIQDLYRNHQDSSDIQDQPENIIDNEELRGRSASPRRNFETTSRSKSRSSWVIVPSRLPSPENKASADIESTSLNLEAKSKRNFEVLAKIDQCLKDYESNPTASYEDGIHGSDTSKSKAVGKLAVLLARLPHQEQKRSMDDLPRSISSSLYYQRPRDKSFFDSESMIEKFVSRLPGWDASLGLAAETQGMASELSPQEIKQVEERIGKIPENETVKGWYSTLNKKEQSEKGFKSLSKYFSAS